MTGKSYQHTNNPLLAAAKKTGMKREHSPSNPYKRKARGKENNPGALSTGLSACVGAGACERIRAREAMRKRMIEAAVMTALVTLGGTRRNPLFDRQPGKNPCDERLWANFAWEFGYGKLLDLVDQAKAEIAEHHRPVADKDKPKILQALITPSWKRGAK